MNESFETEGKLFTGLFWGSLVSIPLWLSLFGWVKLIIRFVG